MFAYAKTQNDADAAFKLGIAVDAFKRWRQSLGLRRKNPSTKPRRRHSVKPVECRPISIEAIRDLLKGEG